ELFGDRRRVEHLRRCQVGGKAFELQMWRRFQSGTDPWQLLHCGSEPPHATIELQMNRKRGNTYPGRRSLKELNVPGFPDRGCQIEPDDLFLFAAPESSHQQDSAFDSLFAQGNRLVERRDAEPGRAFLFEGP